MRDATALRLAIDLMLVPSRVRAQRASPLPSGVAFLLQVAAYDEQAMREAVRLHDQTVGSRASGRRILYRTDIVEAWRR